LKKLAWLAGLKIKGQCYDFGYFEKKLAWLTGLKMHGPML
jgi:hypothetical protein